MLVLPTGPVPAPILKSRHNIMEKVVSPVDEMIVVGFCLASRKA